MACVVVFLPMLGTVNAHDPACEGGEACPAPKGGSQLLQRATVRGHLTLDSAAAAGLTEATFNGNLMHRLLWRDGLKLDGPLPEAEKALKEQDSTLRPRCPPALDGSLALLDAAQDTSGGQHWLLRGSAPDLRGDGQASAVLLHVSRSASGRFRFSPAAACGRGEWPALLEANADGPSLLGPDNRVVEDSKVFVLGIVREKTAQCAAGQVTSITVLSAETSIVDGLEVTLSADLEVTSPSGGKSHTYHHISVLWEVKDGRSDLVPRLDLPDDIKGQDLSFCDLATTSTEAELAQLATREGHTKVSQFHRMLGWRGAFRDAGENVDALIQKAETAQCPGSANLPPEYLLRTHPTHARCFTRRSVQDQGGCGSCWAFAASTAASGRACMLYPDEIDATYGREQFSVQQVMSCNENGEGCEGGWMGTAFEEYKRGISLTRSYVYSPGGSNNPWHAQGLACQWGLVQKPYIATANYGVQGAVAAMQSELFCNGPYTVAFGVYNNFFGFFSGDSRTGVYTAASGSMAGGHAVTLVGWGTMNGTDYWQLINSWGSGWGDEGYFKMRRGVDLCNIESWGIVAVSVQRTNASWMYGAWTNCTNGWKRRGVRCSGTSDSMCPLTNGVWPSKATFPTNTTYPEKAPVAFSDDCGGSPGVTCSAADCNYRGTVISTVVGNQTLCSCTCNTGYNGTNCDSCANGYEGYPSCRAKCTREEDCGGRGDASGQKWTNEFGARLDSCSCSCDAGWTGTRCERGPPPPSSGPVRYVRIRQTSNYLQVSAVAVVNDRGVNVALGQPTTSSPGGWGGEDPNIPVTGTPAARTLPNMFHGGNQGGFWMVDLRTGYTVHNVTYFNRLDCCQDRANFAVLELLSADQRVLASRNLGSALVQTFDFRPPPPSTGPVRFVKIDQPSDWLQVAYVQVINDRGENVALGKPAKATAGYNEETGNPQNPVTGVPGVRSYPNIFHGGFTNSWWMVDLQSGYTIHNVTYFNRQDCCQDRARSATLQLLDANQRIWQSRPLDNGLVQTFDFRPAGLVRFVRIDQPSDFLQISALEVFDPRGTSLAQGKSATSSPLFGGGASAQSVVSLPPALRPYPNITHSLGSNRSWWQVDLGVGSAVRNVVYYNRLDCCQARARFATVQLLDANLNVLDSRPLTAALVQNLMFQSPSSAAATTFTRARYVRIVQASDVLQVSALEVINERGVNVAAGKFITSTPARTKCNPLTGTPDVRAFPNIFHSSNSSQNWLQVDLLADVNVRAVVYYNRQDCCQNRAASAIVQLLDANMTVVGSQPLTNRLVQVISF